MRRKPYHAPLVAAALIGFASFQFAWATNGSVTYTYDSLARISTASYGSGTIVLYSYDAAGNPSSRVQNVNTAALSWTLTPTPPSCTTNCWNTTSNPNWGVLKWSFPPPPCAVNCWGAALWHQ